MSFLLISLALALFALRSFAQLPDCKNKINIRYEWRDLPRAEQEKFLNALVALTKSTTYESFARLHVTNFNQWHRNPMFFPVHRFLNYQFDTAVKAIDPTVVLPYWDWSIDSKDPLSGSIWKDFGNPALNGGCVKDGAFANLKLNYPVNHCLTRNASNTILDDTASIYAIIQTATTFADMAPTIENRPHQRFHAFLGGGAGNGDMAYAFSPNDPMFFMHHGFIDSIWNAFQLFDSRKFSSFSGDANAELPGFSGVRVKDIFDTKNLCFVYAKPGTKFVGQIVTSPQSPTTPPLPPSGNGPSPNLPNNPLPKPISPSLPPPAPLPPTKASVYVYTTVNGTQTAYITIPLNQQATCTFQPSQPTQNPNGPPHNYPSPPSSPPSSSPIDEPNNFPAKSGTQASTVYSSETIYSTVNNVATVYETVVIPIATVIPEYSIQTNNTVTLELTSVISIPTSTYDVIETIFPTSSPYIPPQSNEPSMAPQFDFQFSQIDIVKVVTPILDKIIGWDGKPNVSVVLQPPTGMTDMTKWNFKNDPANKDSPLQPVPLYGGDSNKGYRIPRASHIAAAICVLISTIIIYTV